MLTRNDLLVAIVAAVAIVSCSCNTQNQFIQEYLNEMKAKQAKDGIVYDPNHGYEPYWENGDWVFMKKNTPSHSANATTTTTVRPHQVCGEDCPDQYVHIKQVCGRRISYMDYAGCTGSDCWGEQLDDYSVGYKTFDTFCQFLDYQCHSDFLNRWIFVHGGACVKQQQQYLRPISSGSQLVSRVTWYYTALSQARHQNSLPPVDFAR